MSQTDIKDDRTIIRFFYFLYRRGRGNTIGTMSQLYCHK